MGEVFREAITLVGCRDFGGKTGVTSQKDVEIRCAFALEGSIYLESEEDQRFARLGLRLTDQDAWSGWSSFESKRFRDSSGLVSASAEFVRPANLEAVVDGGLLRLIDDSSIHEDSISHRITLQTQSRFEFNFDEAIGLRDIMSRYAYPLQVLLLTATGRLPGAISMSGTNDDWFKTGEASPLRTRWVTIRRFHGGDAGLQPNSIRYLHRLEDFDFATQLPLVITSVTKHRLAFERYAEMLSEGGGGPQSKFVALTQVIDAYDRSSHPGERRTGAFGVPVRRMDAEAKGYIANAVGLGEDWAFYVGELRNIVTHGDEKTKLLVEDPAPLDAAHQVLSILFEIHILLGFGFDLARSIELVESRHPYSWRVASIRQGFPRLVSFVDTHPKARSSTASPAGL